jgi:hypothetical protein
VSNLIGNLTIPFFWYGRCNSALDWTPKKKWFLAGSWSVQQPPRGMNNKEELKEERE